MMGDRDSWHSQDTFWELVEPFLFNERRMALAGEQVSQIIALLDIKEGARILDLPCGNGRHSLALAHLGYEVSGIDRTQRYIESARAEASQRGLKVEFKAGDMRDVRSPGRYDAILNLFGSFGYFEDAADDLKMVQNMYDSLRPGGRFMIETAGKEILARDFRARDWFEHGELLTLVERKVTHNWGRIETRYIVIRGSERFEQTVSIRSFSAGELVSLLAAAGFSEVQVYGSLDGSSYDQDAQRLVVVGRK